MKRMLAKIQPLLLQVHPYPFWVLTGCVYGATIAFALCGGVTWFPVFSDDPHRAILVGETLFQIGNSFLAVGGVTATVMDIILHKDTPPKN